MSLIDNDLATKAISAIITDLPLDATIDNGYDLEVVQKPISELLTELTYVAMTMGKCTVTIFQGKYQLILRAEIDEETAQVGLSHEMIIVDGGLQ